MSAEFDQLVAKFEEFQAGLKNVDDRFANLGAMQADLSTLEATATSPDRSVTVVAGPGGAVLDIRVTDQALSRGAQALSITLMTTLRDAVAEAARKQASIVEEHMGDDLHLVDQVLETQAEVLGTSVDELRSKMDEATPERRRPDHSDDFSEQTVLRSTEEPPRPAPPASGGSDGDRFLKNLFDEDH